MPTGIYERKNTIQTQLESWDRLSPLEGLMIEVDHGYFSLCWDATFDLSAKYPRVSIESVRLKVAEYLLGLQRGRGYQIVSSHLCDNTRCCRPNHLMIDSQSGNIKLMYDHGRRSTKGELSGHNILTQAEVDEIRNRMIWVESRNRYIWTYHGQFKDLAEEFGVNPRTISCIATGKRWSWE